MFTIHCENIVRAAASRKAPGYPNTDLAEPLTLTERLASSLRTGADRLPLHPSETKSGDTQRKHSRTLHPDMIRRMDGAPQLVNPSGSIIEGAGPASVLSPDPQMTWDHLSQRAPLRSRQVEPPAQFHAPLANFLQGSLRGGTRKWNALASSYNSIFCP
jgi:hypothetical protein